MKIAVTYENGNIYQHFGHTQTFKLYETENGKIAAGAVVETDGSGHGALAAFLAERGVGTLICGGIGGGAKAALAEAGIAVYGGAAGNADEAVAAFLAGTLRYDPEASCSHHEHAYGTDGACGSGGCGSHGCADR